MDEAEEARAGPDWLVVNTHTHREGVAVENLKRQGFEPYCPMVLKRVRQSRRRPQIPAPMFPGYVFVAHHKTAAHWRPIRSTLGVRAVLSDGATPSRLAGAIIEAIKAREVDGVVRRPHASYEVGQRVRVSAGAIDGAVGEIIDLRDRDRVVVLLGWLQNQIRTEVRIEDLEPAPKVTMVHRVGALRRGKGLDEAAGEKPGATAPIRLHAPGD